MLPHVERLSPCQTVETRSLVVTVALMALLGAGAIVVGQPLAAAAVMLVVPLVGLGLAYSHWLVPVVVFMIYANIPTVAIRFHGVPRAAGILIPLLLAVPLARYLIFERRNLVFPRTFPLVALFVLIQLLGVWGTIAPDVAREVVKTTVTEGLLLYLLVVNVVRTREHVLRATWALLLAGCFMGALSVFQQATGTFGNQYGGFAQVPGLGFHVLDEGVKVRQARMCGPVGEQNRYAQVMLMLVPLGLYLCWSLKAGLWRMLAVCATGFSAAGCVLAFSRGAAVGFVVMLLVMVVMRQLSLRHLGVFVVGLALLLLLTPSYRQRLLTLGEVAEWSTKGHVAGGEMDGAIRGRATVMLAAARVTADYPVLGVGPGMFNFYSRDYGMEGGLRALEGGREAHSLYLELSAEHGLLGLGCFLAMVGISLANLTRARRLWAAHDKSMSYLATGYSLAIVSYLTTGLFLHFSYARYFWLMLALADATGYLATKSLRESTTSGTADTFAAKNSYGTEEPA